MAAALHSITLPLLIVSGLAALLVGEVLVIARRHLRDKHAPARTGRDRVPAG